MEAFLTTGATIAVQDADGWNLRSPDGSKGGMNGCASPLIPLHGTHGDKLAGRMTTEVLSGPTVSESRLWKIVLRQ